MSILYPCLWPGALTVDEALTLSQAVCGGNAGTMAFILMPQQHSSCTHTAILAHRRLLEDKAAAILSGVKLIVGHQGPYTSHNQ